MKNRLIAAALAAFFMLPVFSFTAYATEIETEDISEIEIIAEEPDTGEYPDTDAEVTQDAPPAEEPGAAELPPLPPGTATVIDYNTDPDGRLFYTIMTPDEHVFYLVIDKNRNADNVYFLNAVTVADLLPLAQMPATPPNGAVTTPPNINGGTEQPGETPPPPEDEPQQGGGMGMYIFIIVLAIVGGGAGWYFKIYRPKQQGAASGDEYDPTLNDSDNDYSDDWGDDSDDDSGEAVDAPPWDEDGESTDSDDK